MMTQAAAGLEPGGEATELAVSGMTCGNCARHVTEAIRGVAGVSGVSVNLDGGRALVRWGTKPDVSAVLAAVKEAGYEAKAVAPAELKSNTKRDWSPLAGWRFNVVVGLACTAPLIIGEWVLGLEMQPWFRWLEFALAAVVQVFCGARFYAGAWRQLKSGSANMDALVSLGSTTAFGYSVWALLSGAHGHLYFTESAAIITLISVGHWVEARTSTRAESSLQTLLHLAPQLARRRNADGSESEVAARDLRVGDLVVLRPGDNIPADGEVVEGDSVADESMLTGESNPVEKGSGDAVYGGTTNVNGRLVVRVTATGAATALAQIIAAVERAQSSRAEIQRLGDRVSSVFVPVVVLVALATGLWWGLEFERAQQVTGWLHEHLPLWPAAVAGGALAAAFIQASAVLIVACPCAMGLATPAAIMAGTNAAARRGILIRDGVALERAGKITALVFDKTGTITQGKPVVVETFECGVRTVRPCSPQVAECGVKELGKNEGGSRSLAEAFDAGQVAAGLARGSSHPVSQAVAKLAGEDVALVDWEEKRGAGVQARLAAGGVVVRLGSLRWLRECGVDMGRGAEFEAKWGERGATLLGVSADKNLLGMLAVQDALKAGAPEVVRRLRESGLEVYLVTGDNAATARAIAKQAGIAEGNVFAEARPEQKAEILQELRGRGKRVAFVGDGINDAPALEAADLGIAVSRASDVAREAADIILLKREIEAVPEALSLAQATLRTIKQNLFWAFFYNAAGIPLAAMGFMSPILCAAAMGVSDLVVIGNALRLLRGRR